MADWTPEQFDIIHEIRNVVGETRDDVKALNEAVNGNGSRGLKQQATRNFELIRGLLVGIIVVGLMLTAHVYAMSLATIASVGGLCLAVLLFWLGK